MITELTQYENVEVGQDDLDLVRATKAGDISAFEQLVVRYDRKLLRIAQRFTRNQEDSEDAVQETFMNAYEHLSGFREDSKFSTWLFRIVVNQCLVKLRKRGRIKEVSLEEECPFDDAIPVEIPDRSPTPEEQYRFAELHDMWANAVERLPEIFRTVLVLQDVEGLSIRETAEILGLTPAAVKARISRGRLQLRRSLSNYSSIPSQPPSSFLQLVAALAGLDYYPHVHVSRPSFRSASPVVGD